MLVARAMRKESSTTQSNIMNQNTLSAEGFESTYALLVRSEEKDRSLFEDAAYLIFILSAIFSIWLVLHQPVELPKGPVIHTISMVQPTDTHTQPA
jgi:hypothetical protein